MRTSSAIVALLVLASLSAAARADIPATPLDSRIESIGLFKNGIAVVKRVVDVPAIRTASGSETFMVADVPEPVHGTFWIESNAQVTVRVTTRNVTMPLDDRAGADFQRELVGRDVTIHLREAGMQPINGRVLELVEDQAPRWSRNYQPPNYSYWNYSGGGYLGGSDAPLHSRYLILETRTGRSYVDASMIAALHVEGTASSVTRRKPVLMFHVTGQPGGEPSAITVTYLSKGMAWAPSYRVDIGDPATLKLVQQAVIRNEMEDITNAELFLISGFPSIEFGHVTSPLSPGASLASFFQQLATQGGLRHFSRGDVVSQQAIMTNIAPYGDGGVDLSAIPDGEGVDLHYRSIGKHGLDAGDSLMLTVASGSAPYERIVEWIIPDTRNAQGQLIADYERQQHPEKYQDSAWDAVRFRNPLGFPMTTAPAMIVAGDRFNGQRTSFWVNAGEQTTLQVTKALSVRTRSIEWEEEGEREIVSVGGHKFRKTPVKGELAVSNHRAEAVTMVIRRRFSGELIEAAGSPAKTFLEEGVYSINRRNELTWTITLKPGEERALAYRYTVLVPH